MVELKLGGVGVGLAGVETAAVFLQYRLDAVGDARSDRVVSTRLDVGKG